MEELEKTTGKLALTAPVLVRPANGLHLSHFKNMSGEKRQEGSDSLFLEYARLFKRRRGLLLCFALGGVLLGWAVTIGVQPVYRARTSLDIQNLNADFLDMNKVSQTNGNDATSSEAYVQTQIKLLQSDTLRERTVNAIARDGAVSAQQREDLFSSLRRSLHLPGDTPVTKQELLGFTAKHLLVKPVGLTRLVEVTCDSWSANFAAEFCNRLTAEFANQDRDVRFSQAKTTSEWLSKQLADVQESVQQAQKRLEARSGNSDLTLKEGGASVAEEKLRELQAELMRAKAERVEKQAQYEISRSSAPDSLPMVLDSAQLKDAQMRLDDLHRQLSAKVPPLTEANPLVIHLRSQIREIEATLSTEKKDVLDRMRNEYLAASHREGLLNAEYRAQEVRVAQEQGRESQLTMLKKELDSGEQLYQTLLQRVKEAGFASAMQASTIRVVDAARPPLFTIAPRRGVSAFVGMLLGLLAGVACAFFKERTQSVLRGPGEVARYLNLRELGVIPSAKRGLRQLSPKPVPPLRRPAALLGQSPAPSPVQSVPKPHKPMDMAVWQDDASLVAEAYRNTTYSVLLAGNETERARTFVVTSPSVGEGKTTVTCNLGLALAQANRRVLLIDGDLRKPRLHKAMDVRNEVGLRDLLRGDIDAKIAPTEAFCQPTAVPGLFVIPSGKGSEEPSGLLHSLRFRTLLDRLTSEFDFVLIDSPPMMHMADARILAGMSNGVILVFRARVTDLETAATTRDLFLDDNVRVIGTILNDFDPSKEGKGQYYKSYYQYADLSKAPATESKSA
ncbi:MAG TPA: polysaccharide biosynthesis tyrosine autokinase [Bryobacteraceae bacterium]|nr:polysaccharide biosynthesis tyrosine autokinase [Bryobacteraceae bacterium]